MAIKAVNEIPGENKKCSQRELIRQDIREAFEKSIEKFEFEGESYKYDTLIINARETLKIWFHREIYFPAYKKAKEKLKEKITEPFWGPMAHEYDKKVYSLSKRKLSDRVHVYCSLNIEMLKNMEQVIYDDTLKLYEEKCPEQIIK